jgi:aminoglycoside phosphotransferase (APT) family kinase protein
LASGTLTEPDSYFFIATAGPEKRSETELSLIHFDFLAGLITASSVDWCVLLYNLSKDAESLCRDENYAPVVMKALAFLRKADAPPARICIEHGDFTPWNIRLKDNGQLFVLDWEDSRCDGLPWLDALHFVYQIHALVHRQRPKRVLSALRKVFALPAAQDYAETISGFERGDELFIVIYLLGMLMAAKKEGRLSNNQDSVNHSKILELLVA